MKVGSFNTMSYVKPRWFMRPFRKFIQYQTKTIEQQYKEGIRVFDLHIDFKRNYMAEATPYFASGLCLLRDENVYLTLNLINEWSKKYFKETGEYIICRLIYESHGNEVAFTDFCHKIFRKYKYIQFCGARTNDFSWHENWPIRSEKDNYSGAGDFGSIDVRKGSYHYASWPKSGFKLEYELKNFV